MTRERLVAALTGDGRITTLQQETPPLRPGAVLVEVHASLVSPGTEVGGWRALAAQREDPSPVAEAKPFGYSNSGIVLDTGEGAEELKPGDRIACVGAGYAQHTNYAVVPHHLCVALPDGVTFAQGAYAMLAATAMHGVRRAELALGEFVAVVGLGILGQLCARLHQLDGQFAIGWDTIRFRTGLATRWGIDATATVGEEDEVEATNQFTGGRGLDGGVLAMGGDGNAAIRSLGQCMKISPDGHCMGRIIVVGNPSFDYRSHEPRGMTNIDIRRASRTGPGYHDEAWEHGPAYPPVFMRWTTRTNLELCVRLIAEGRLDVDALTTHTIPLADVESGIAAIIDSPDEILGVVLEM